MKNRIVLVNELEESLGVCFSDKSLLETSITHSSFANLKKEVKYNERLEFLGDSVLQLCITEYLFTNYMNKSEGELTKIRSLIVCENSLFEIADKWQLGKYISMSKGEELTGGRKRVSIQADCIEAIIAAVYLDKGMEDTKKFIIKNFKNTIEKAIHNEIVLDYKTKLQEIIQKKKDIEITYKLEKYEGPPHLRKFYVDVIVNNNLMGQGIGFSKKEAEQLAAKEALLKMEVAIE